MNSLGIVAPEDIDVEAIAYYVGLRVKRRHLNCCEAMITGMGERGIISVQPQTMPARQRFSIAHELGHWANDRGKSVACRSTEIGKFSTSNSTERTADQYAADLLMPWPFFKDVCRQHRRVDLRTLRYVADMFKCSLTATLIRMIDSKLYPNVMMVTHTKNRKWHRSASEIPGYWYPRSNLDKESFAHNLLTDPNAEDERFPRKIGADAWFDNPAADRYEITEQSFRVPDEGVVTILRLDERMTDV